MIYLYLIILRLLNYPTIGFQLNEITSSYLISIKQAQPICLMLFTTMIIILQ